jgi:3-isopropylmalate/(R)-2-methylmalate dehydratase small subunit
MSKIVKIIKASGTAVPIRGNDIDTDRIIPARYLKEVTFARMGDYPFFDERYDASGKKKDHPFNDPEYRGASLLFVNKNFGCGSSREHAPQAIRRRGFRAVVGESFSEIFFGNSVALGLPCVTAGGADVDALLRFAEAAPGGEMTIDLDALTIRLPDRAVGIGLPPAARESFLDGTWDATALLLDRFEQVEAVAARLPYLREWR